MTVTVTLAPTDASQRRLAWLETAPKPNLAQHLSHRAEWQASGLCRDHPDINFFPQRGDDTAPAKAICAACPVRRECAAAGAGEHHGVWGGTTSRYRRAQRARGDVGPSAA